MKRTPWFNAHTVKPVHVGRYEYLMAGVYPLMLLWDGQTWRNESWPLHPWRGDKWRGLAEKP